MNTEEVLPEACCCRARHAPTYSFTGLLLKIQKYEIIGYRP